MSDRSELVLTRDLPCPNDTEAVAARLAKVVIAGMTIGLMGTLGAGKTFFVRAFAQACGVPAHFVTSPTYVLCQQYAADRFVIQHLDVYRLNSAEEFLDMGPEELFESSNVTLIEWADKVAKFLPEERLEIEFLVTGEQSRSVVVRGYGTDAVEVAKALLPAAKP